MLQFPLIVVGGSAGSIQPLIHLATGLPANFLAVVCIVIHTPAHGRSYLPEILARAGPLPATYAQNLERIKPGHLYCAPPDHHLLVGNGHLCITEGLKEHWSRPAIDPLFRSAAHEEGSNVIGVVLSDMLKDGSSGLWSIRKCGGIAVVQDPDDADHDSMPRNALVHVDVDHIVRSQDLAPLLIDLVSESAQRRAAPDGRGRNQGAGREGPVCTAFRNVTENEAPSSVTLATTTDDGGSAI